MEDQMKAPAHAEYPGFADAPAHRSELLILAIVALGGICLSLLIGAYLPLPWELM